MPINTQLVRLGLEQASARLRSQRETRLSRTRGETPTSEGTATRTQQTTFPGEAPTLPALPEFTAPEAAPGELAGETQRLAAPQIRSLRDITAAALSGAASQPANIRKMTVRQALQGFGGGLESIVSGARRGAQAVVQSRLGRETQAAQLNFQASVNSLMNQYANQWKQFLSGGVTTVTSTGADTGGGGQGLRVAPSTLNAPRRVVDLNDPRTIGSRTIQ